MRTPLNIILENKKQTSCPKLKPTLWATIIVATKGGQLIVATKGRQLMVVATSENPGAGFGDLCVCDLPFRCPPFVPYLLPSCPKCVRVPGVRRCKCWLCPTPFGQPPFPHCPFVAETSQIVRMSVLARMRSQHSRVQSRV